MRNSGEEMRPQTSITHQAKGHGAASQHGGGDGGGAYASGSDRKEGFRGGVRASACGHQSVRWDEKGVFPAGRRSPLGSATPPCLMS